jgi:4-hydroxy-3-polyprenylbenzoate decarboxylase
LGNRRFRYCYKDGFAISTDADFVITGEVYPGENKPEGPFGDHLGYYSLTHSFPLMRVHKVYAKKNAIWPFTVVGRPPQEDTSFGQLIHEIAGEAIKHEIPGVKEVHAVDAAGVHPLLLAIGSERYTPYLSNKQPAELLTIANHILGKGQLSLAKFLFITAEEERKLSTHKEEEFFTYMLERIHLDRDIHFHTQTTMDTLDYSGSGLNTGSKVVFAAYGDPVRELSREVHSSLNGIPGISDIKLIMPGILSIQTSSYENEEQTEKQILLFNEYLIDKHDLLKGLPLIIWSDDADFTAKNLRNFLWVAFTRCNPSHDIHGIGAFTKHKHWGCTGAVIIDARIKPHHAPTVELDPEMVRKTDRFFQKSGSLANL